MAKPQVLTIIKQINQIMTRECPPHKQMLQELLNIRVKVRAVEGNIFNIKTDNYFLSSIWKISKIDQIVTTSLHLLDPNDMSILTDYLHSIQEIGLDRKTINNALKNKKAIHTIKLELFKDEQENIRH